MATGSFRKVNYIREKLNAERPFGFVESPTRSQPDCQETQESQSFANYVVMNSVVNWIDRAFTTRRWLIHFIFWIAILGFYVVFFGRRNNNYIQTFFFIALLMPVTIATTYLFNYFLIPRYLFKGRYLLFALYSFYAILLSVFLEMMMALVTFFWVAGQHIKNMSPASFDLIFLFSSLLLVVFFGASIKLLLHWKQSSEDNQRLMREKVEIELKFLKTQLNPHFLFNTLNNLYYLSLQKSDESPKAILALSEILDYVLHAGRQVMVPLTDELKQVENYINLELLRYQDRVEVKRSITGDLSQHTIGPMMLMTLIENSFKHGVMNSHKAWVSLSVAAHQGSVAIEVANSCVKTDIGQGIGLTNLRSQLSHIYPRHELHTQVAKGEFLVRLIINQ